MSGSWRPITDDERPHLIALGNELQRLREIACLSQLELAYHATISDRHLQYLEYGERRTRQSTLRRIVRVIVEAHPQFGSEDRVLSRLLELGGPAIAPESAYADRVERRRNQRRRRFDQLLARTTFAEHAWYESGRRP